MAYEFKKLSDVETVEVPADTANVLIEEDGVIKKAPKTAVGGAESGGSGETLDLYLTINGSPSADTISIVEGSFDALSTAYSNGIANVRIDFLKDSVGCTANIRPTVWLYGGYWVFLYTRVTASSVTADLTYAYKCNMVFKADGTYSSYSSAKI